MSHPNGETTPTQPTGTEGNEGGGQQPTPTPTPKPGEHNQGGGQQPDLDTPKFSQRQYNAFEQRIKQEYRQKREADEQLIELGRKAQEAENASRPLEERLATVTGDNTAIARERDDLRIENMRIRLAGKAQLHPDLWDRVRGNTEDEINADIETLKPFSPPPGGGGTTPRGPQPNHQQGNPSTNPNATGSVSAGRDLHSQRHGVKNGA